VKNKRDSIIIFGLMKGINSMELNDMLYEMEKFVLQCSQTIPRVSFMARGKIIYKIMLTA